MTKPVLYGLRYSPWSRKARWALDAHGVDVDYREYLLGEFTYADVTIAMAMQFVAPVDESVIRIGERSRRYWTDEALAEDFADVMAWRDRVFELRPE